MKEIELKLAGKLDRLTNKTLKFDERIRDGWFSAVYFLKTREIVRKNLPGNEVTMQFFQKKDAVLCGTDESIALIHTFAKDPKSLVIHSLKDGDKIKPYETVLTVQSPYENFVYLDGLIIVFLCLLMSVAMYIFFFI